MASSGFDVAVEQGLPVVLPSGATFFVLTQDEVRYVENLAQRYMKENHFVNIADHQDVDRMLILELLCYRYGLWLSREKDYWDDAVDEKNLRATLEKYSVEIRNVKKGLGIDKQTRDKEKGEDSFPEWLARAKERAREFGVMREEQLNKALELFNELKALVTLHRNCDATEQREMHVTAEDVIEWIANIALPEFDAIDEHFRTHKQRFWVRKM